MKHAAIAAALAAGLTLGSLAAVQAKLPAAPPMSVINPRRPMSTIVASQPWRTYSILP